MSKQELITVRIESKLKYNAERIFFKLGLSPNDAINLFYKQVCLTSEIPFVIKVPKKIRAKTILMSKLKESEDEVADGNGWMSIEDSKNKLGLE